MYVRQTRSLIKRTATRNVEKVFASIILKIAHYFEFQGLANVEQAKYFNNILKSLKSKLITV